MFTYRAYYGANEEIANNAVKLFQEQLHAPQGLIGELDNWQQVIGSLQQEIEEIERARASAQASNDRLNSLKDQYDRLKKKQAVSSGTSASTGSSATAAQEARDLEERIKETTNVTKSLVKEFKEQKQKIGDVVTNMLKEKYRIFDRVYVQLLECQLAFVAMCGDLTKPFQPWVEYYRKQYPKTYSDSNEHPLYQSTEKLVQRRKSPVENSNNGRPVGERNSSHDQDSNSKPNANTAETDDTRGYENVASPSASKGRNSAKNSENGNNSNSNTNHSSKTNGTPHSRGNSGDIKSSAARVKKNSTASAHSVFYFYFCFFSPLPQKKKKKKKRVIRYLLRLIQTHVQKKKNSESKNPVPSSEKNKNQTSATSPHEHNDFLFGDFASPTSEHQSNPTSQKKTSTTEDEHEEFGHFMDGSNHSTTKKQPEKQYPMGNLFESGKNRSQGDRKDKDFWGMFDTETASKRKGTDTDKPKSPNQTNAALAESHKSNFSKSESQISRPNASGNASSSQKRGHNHLQPVNEQPRSKSESPETPKTELSHLSFSAFHPLKGKQRANGTWMHNFFLVQERMRFVKESYAQEAKEQAERIKYKDEIESKLDEWEYANGARRNIRSLLTKLPEILWEDSGWKPVSLGDLVQPAKCKRAYQVALRVVHPDRATNRGDDTKQAVICERVFTALNEAWTEFEKTL
ncbi:hypothetical protein RFI_14204 [Reticulomyxa filosa]|uniref:J domain-containing protein n=1 Tax=Reticulomyxa filosa TaxID=46433 RepID=X6NB51_RETFI|nr:hypothetical protein RFI_14204 [Reticulomyxa filosa]|eukprot:ETO22984.1 hypothetical protein RFI_14204 [Reticulomyxa filosa]